MLLRDLVTEARVLLDDVQGTSTDPRDLLWSDPELLSWANEAVREAAMRTQSLRSNITVQFPAGTGRVSLPQDVIGVGENAVLLSLPVPRRTHVLREDDTDERWGTIHGLPSAVAYMDVPSELWLNMAPTAPFDVSVDVVTVPVAPLAPGDTIPLPFYQHSQLVHWVLYKAYLKNDTETEDMVRAKTAQAAFDRAFGQQQSFAQVAVQKDKTRQRVRASFF